MFNNLSYNTLKKYNLTALLILLLVYLIKLFLSQFLSKVLVYILLAIGLLLYSATTILGSYSYTAKHKKTVLRDELSSANEAEAAEFTFLVISVVLLIVLGVTFFTSIEMTFSFDSVFCFYIAIQCVKDGHYLYLEKVGDRDAGIDDKD